VRRCAALCGAVGGGRGMADKENALGAQLQTPAKGAGRTATADLIVFETPGPAAAGAAAGAGARAEGRDDGGLAWLASPFAPGGGGGDRLAAAEARVRELETALADAHQRIRAIEADHAALVDRYRRPLLCVGRADGVAQSVTPCLSLSLCVCANCVGTHWTGPRWRACWTTCSGTWRHSPAGVACSLRAPPQCARPPPPPPVRSPHLMHTHMYRERRGGKRVLTRATRTGAAAPAHALADLIAYAEEERSARSAVIDDLAQQLAELRAAQVKR
jgi:hypothetical protein